MKKYKSYKVCRLKVLEKQIDFNTRQEMSYLKSCFEGFLRKEKSATISSINSQQTLVKNI